jgi:hypothetical protein
MDAQAIGIPRPCGPARAAWLAKPLNRRSRFPTIVVESGLLRA